MTDHKTSDDGGKPQRIAYTVKEAQERVPLPTSTFYKAVAAGEISSVRIGRKILIPVKPFHSKFGGSPS
jgi:excisionase family DNA binding protein